MCTSWALLGQSCFCKSVASFTTGSNTVAFLGDFRGSFAWRACLELENDSNYGGLAALNFGCLEGDCLGGGVSACWRGI